MPFKVKRNLKKSRVKKHKKNLGKSIDLRPKHIESREEFGHSEIDKVIGKYGANDDVILTLLERKTRNYIAVKIKDKTATSVKEGLEYVLSMYKDKVKEVFKSITCDNGLEFASLNKDFSSITDIYYAHPYSSWERGSNERHNGLLRRFIPKYTTIKEYTKEQILYYSDIINAIPRKILGYKTPEELFESCLDSIYSV